jgi:hypothetical protein
LAILWPIVSSLLLVKAALGVIVGIIEGWGLWKGVYFALITGLTIGYGDLVPSQPATQVLAIIIGFLGVVLMGLVAALAVKAFEITPKPPSQ